MSDLERSLLRRLRDRDERAFRELIDGHRYRVYSIVYRMLGNRHEAEDVSQEVFITVFKTIESFHTRGTPPLPGQEPLDDLSDKGIAS